MRISTLLFLSCFAGFLPGNQLGLTAQVNLVPNPSFEELSDCDLEYGEADKAFPWQIVNDPIATPDLYHSCSENPFFLTPIPNPGNPIFPKSGDGMLGLVNMVPRAEERVFAYLTDELPIGMDIYVAYSILPRHWDDSNPYNSLCYSNTQSLAFADENLGSREVILGLDTILDNSQDWSLIQACYQANGNERIVLLGNYQLTSQTLQTCNFIDPDVNFAYFFVDDVIVSPFDIVPDFLFICGEEVLEYDTSFFEVPLQWSDGWMGGSRTFTESGTYTIQGDIGDCFLTDETTVVKISDETEMIPLELCRGGELTINTPVLAVWQNGDTSSSRVIKRPGVYTAELLSSCGQQIREYLVTETDCDIQYFVPNVFSPNDDGINDQLEFFFTSDFSFTGDLQIFDRWGQLLFQAKDVNAQNPVRWDGTAQGEALNPAVFVWVYRYVSAKDGRARVISGDVTLIR